MIKKEKKKDFGIDVEEMKRAGIYFGHRSSKCHPKMKPFVLGVKGSNHVHILDIEQTIEKLKEALEFIQKISESGKKILFVGTKLGVGNLIKETAQETDSYYVYNRWLGGTITNFKIIQKRLNHFKDLEKKKKSGELEKYTKKERLGFDKELADLERKFGGIKEMNKFPDALFVVDVRKENLAVKEAKAKDIPVVGIVDTDSDPSTVDYPIPANDDAISSVKYILDKVKEVIK